jgi:hypothetical protein
MLQHPVSPAAKGLRLDVPGTKLHDEVGICRSWPVVSRDLGIDLDQGGGRQKVKSPTTPARTKCVDQFSPGLVRSCWFTRV